MTTTKTFSTMKTCRHLRRRFRGPSEGGAKCVYEGVKLRTLLGITPSPVASVHFPAVLEVVCQHIALGSVVYWAVLLESMLLLTWFHLARAHWVALPAVKTKGRIPPTVDRPAQTPPSDQAQGSAGPCRQPLYGPCQPAVASKFYVHHLPIGAQSNRLPCSSFHLFLCSAVCVYARSPPRVCHSLPSCVNVGRQPNCLLERMPSRFTIFDRDHAGLIDHGKIISHRKPRPGSATAVNARIKSVYANRSHLS
jgi:hypothetical protein